MSTVEINGQHFNCGKLPTRTQWHVVRRLMPVLQGLMPLFAMAENARLAPNEQGVMTPDLSGINVFDALAALTNTIGMLSDADADYILDAALSCVRWRQENRWIPILAPGGVFTNGTADQFDVQMRLLWEVLRESLSNFSFANVLPFQPTTNGLDQTEAPPMARPMTRPTA